MLEDFKQNSNQFFSIIDMDLQSIPPSDSFFRGEYFQQMREIVLNLDRQPIPTYANPITSQDDKMLVTWFHLLVNLVLKPEEVLRHPASRYFPGTTTREQNNRPAGPFELEIEMSPHHSDWFNTGLYAISAEEISRFVTTNSSRELGVLIGCHTDDITRHMKWFRLPYVTKHFQLFNNKITKITSPYGGLIYIRRYGAAEVNEIVSVSIQGGYSIAPVFKLGHTSPKEWQETIRYYESPWAEFVSEKIILTAPADSPEKIDDPESILLFWDSVMDAVADLSQIPRERIGQQRIVPDIQISGGYMHSGHPIVTFLGAGDMAINVTQMRDAFNGRGHFHELKHNHQKDAWAFKWTWEVTNNLFALYIYDTVLNLPAEKSHPGLTPEEYKPRIVKYMSTGTDFNKWEPAALLFYIQLQQNYGWDAYRQVFARYNKLGAGEQPDTDEEKIDLWLVVFSEVVNKNLGPFFESWGVPITLAAQSQTNHFPEAKIRITDMIN